MLIQVVPGKRSILVAFLCLGLSSCAYYHGKPFTYQGAASSVIEHRETEGLHAATLDLSDDHESSKLFDRPLKDYGFVPVLLLLELDSNSLAAFNVRREEISLVLQDGTRLEVVSPEEVVAEVGYSHVRSFFGFLMIVPGFFVASSVNQANEDLESDYLAKSFRSVRVSPNMRSYRGVLFFRMPDSRVTSFSMEDAYLEVRAYREGVDEKSMGTRLEFPIHFSR